MRAILVINEFGLRYYMKGCIDMKRSLLVLATLFILLTVPVNASHDNLTWTLRDGLLTVSGSGEMPTFYSPEDQPWYEVRDQITEVVFEDPSTMCIEDMQYWFTGCPNLTRAEIPYTAHIIGKQAFADCPNLTEVLFYYYDSDEFEIVSDAFCTDQPVDTKVYLVSEQAESASRIRNYDWASDNRHVSVYDVYVQEIMYNCGTCGMYFAQYGDYVDHTKYDQCWDEDYSGSSCTHPSSSTSYLYIDDTTHYKSTTCNSCGYVTGTGGSFQHSRSGTSTYVDATYHWVHGTCSLCGGEYNFNYEYHSTTIRYVAKGATSHYVYQYCSGCSTNLSYTTASHTDSNSDGKCDACGYTMGVTISFVVDGTTYSTQSQTSGSYITFPAKPSKEGYVFLGWFTSATNGTQVTEANTVPSVATTYYAQWIPNTSTLRIGLNGGTWSIATSLVEGDNTNEYGTVVTVPVPERVGYTFTGWSLGGALESCFDPSIEGSGWFGTPNGILSGTYEFTYCGDCGAGPAYIYPNWTEGTYTYGPEAGMYDGLSAWWNPNSYIITWDYGEGFYSTTQTYDAAVTLPEQPSKPNAYFGGWYTDPNAGTPITDSIVYNTASNTTYYAHWIQVFSVTVPTTVPIVVTPDGNTVTAPMTISNSSTGDVRITSVSVSTLNDWTHVPMSTDFSKVPVDSKQVAFEITDAANAVVVKDGSVSLSSQAKFSATSTSYSTEPILEIIFILEWASP